MVLLDFRLRPNLGLSGSVPREKPKSDASTYLASKHPAVVGAEIKPGSEVRHVKWIAAIYFDLARYFSAIGAAFYANAAVARRSNRCFTS
jgi:hypothetical protein